jgi:hypothetical protein
LGGQFVRFIHGFLISTGIYSNNLNKHKKQLEILNTKILTDVEYLKDDINQILNNEAREIESENYKVDPEKLLSTLSFESVKIKDIIKKNGNLVFYFGDNYCEDCYRQMIELISNYISKTGTNNIVIMAEYANPRSIKYLLKDFDIKTDIFVVPGGLDIPARSGKKAFFFVIDGTYLVRHVYIPYKKYLDNFETFLIAVDTYLGQNQ